MSILRTLRNTMKRFAFCLTLLFGLTALAGGDEPTTGTIAGTVSFLGEVPAARKVLLSDGGTLLHNDLVVDGPTKGLRYALVHLDKAPPAKGKPAGTAVIDQRDMIFLPRVLAIQEGQKVRFDNNDLCNHGVQAFSAKQENRCECFERPPVSGSVGGHAARASSPPSFRATGTGTRLL